MHDVRFPGETDAYRKARNELIQAELELRRKVEDVAALRRKLPIGGEVPVDYVFEEGASDPDDLETSCSVRLSELFGDKDALLVYSWMYGPVMKEPCPMCTSMLDGLEGQVAHVTQRAALVVVAKSPLRRIRELARGRGWRRLRLLSAANNDYQRDYHGEDAKTGRQEPTMNVFVRRGGKLHHFWCCESLFASPHDGLDSRHIDQFWPLWHLLDLTPEGRGDFYPNLNY